MSKLIPNVSGWVGALFDHLVGTSGTGDDTQGYVSLSKMVFGADQTAPTRVTTATPLPVGVNGSAAVPLQQAGISNALIVGGAAIEGIVPTSNAVHVAGIDGGGLKRTLATDSAGRLILSSAANIATAQVAIAAGTTVLLAAARAGRQTITVVDTQANDVYIGASGVTNTTGELVSGTKGASAFLGFSGALYGYAATATTVTVRELY